ncbi:MAG: hypothetical protein P4L49_04975 [Desulfosporosinus sp.]|nr:hypothetical protein [Desulfosporosinus sp.]
MVRKAKLNEQENEQTQDVEASSELEVTAEASPVVTSVAVIEAERVPVIVEACVQSDDGDTYWQDLTILALKIADLEDKFLKLEIEISALVQKRGRGMKMKKKKEKKVNCKCKGKKVPLSKCKCRSKKKINK